DHANDAATRRSQRDADADLLSSLRDGEGKQAMNSNGGKQQRDGGERAHSARLNRADAGFGVDNLSQKEHVGDGMFRICIMDNAVQRGRKGGGISVGANHQVLRRVPRHPTVWDLLVRKVDLRLARLFEPPHADISDDAYDDAIEEGDIEM